MIFSEFRETARPFFFSLVFCFLFHLPSHGCQCPPTSLSRAETGKYELIFRGKVLEVKPCGTGFGEAVFEVQELFRGNATPQFTVLFECGTECAVGFKTSEEWIVYTRYKQIDNALMDWCSRSRKYFRHAKEDFYLVNYGNDYFHELEFLRKELGHHRLLKEQNNAIENRNEQPGDRQKLLLLLASLAGVVFFYIIFRKWFR